MTPVKRYSKRLSIFIADSELFICAEYLLLQEIEGEDDFFSDVCVFEAGFDREERLLTCFDKQENDQNLKNIGWSI